MSKLTKFLTVAGIGATGAALAGLWYFLDTAKKAQKIDAKDEECKQEPCADRTYVSLEPTDGDKETLKKVVESAVCESAQKAEEKAEGVGIVKDDSNTSDFKFTSFDDKKDAE